MGRLIKVSTEPSCPECGARMKLRRPKPGDHWKPFWGCGDFPNCRGTAEPTYKDQVQLEMWEDPNEKYERV